MEIEGLIINDLGASEGISKSTNKPWVKHEWLLETIGAYPRKVKFTVFGDRVNTIKFEVGQRYLIQVDVESREYNGRWYTDLTAYSCRLLEQGQYVAPGQPAGPFPGVNANPYPGQPEPSAQPLADGNPFLRESKTEFTQIDSEEDLPF